MVSEGQLVTVLSVLPGAHVLSEAGIDYIHLPGLKITTSGEERHVDGLLCPMQHGGYVTRLFLSEPVTGRGNNWTQHVICGRTWHTWSWNNVPSTLPLLQILSAHLRPLQ